MIKLGHSQAPLPSSLMQTPGGFLWWYADLVNDQGDGVVLIWSFGLPFLPGHRDAIDKAIEKAIDRATDKNGRGNTAMPTPSGRPSVNLAVYRGGRSVFYGLQEFAPGEVEWRSDSDGPPAGDTEEKEDRAPLLGQFPRMLGQSPRTESWRFGECRITSTFFPSEHRRVLHADLVLAVPGSRGRANARFTLDGPAIQLHRNPSPHQSDAPHQRSALHPWKVAQDHPAVPVGANNNPPRVDGPGEPHAAQVDDVATPHDWVPWSAVAQARFHLDIPGANVFRVEGRGYHDRNGGAKPLHRLGIAHWIWGRFPFPQRELIVYALWPEGHAPSTSGPPFRTPRESKGATQGRRGMSLLPGMPQTHPEERGGHEPVVMLLEVDREGVTRVAEGLSAQCVGARWSAFGMPYWKQLRVMDQGRTLCSIEHETLHERGPFYLRAAAHATDEAGQRCRGVLELCRPGRIDRFFERPLVSMRVHSASEEDNSLWLPLFAGPVDTRVRRLVQGGLDKLPRPFKQADRNIRNAPKPLRR